MSPTYRGFRVVHGHARIAQSDLIPDCSNFLFRKIVPFMSRISRPIERSRKLCNLLRLPPVKYCTVHAQLVGGNVLGIRLAQANLMSNFRPCRPQV